MKAKQFYMVFLLALLVVVAGVGFGYTYLNYKKYSGSAEGYEKMVADIQNLERSKPYPNAKNLAAMETAVDEYQQLVIKLNESLLTYQRPLNTNITPQQFPQILKSRMESFQKLAREQKLKHPEDFYMGMDDYQASIPPSEAVPLLDYQLQAIDHLLAMLIETGGGVTEIKSLEREKLPEENGRPVGSEEGAPAAQEPVVAKYAVTLCLESDHQPFQDFLNKLGNDKKFFYIIRYLRVENSDQNGPIIGAGTSGDEQGGYVNSEGMPPTPEEWAMVVDLPLTEKIAKMGELGFTPLEGDAKFILGQERLRACLVIDLARFLDLTATAEAAKNAGEGGGDTQ